MIGKQEGQSWAQPDGLSDISGDKSLYTSKKYVQSSQGNGGSQGVDAEEGTEYDSSKAMPYGIRGRCFTD